ncbi:MAG: hypothetical protein LIO42_05880 [Oscillospiraceae bacterium]|nr:hypothetical protein [Oscillospiraceae bacterium]
MCELLGVFTRTKTPVNDLLREFFPTAQTTQTAGDWLFSTETVSPWKRSRSWR